jgi:hypothetical protein
MKEEREVADPLKMSVSEDIIKKDLMYLEKDLQRQLKDSKTKEFWDKTLGETLKSGRVKIRENFIEEHKDLIVKK